MRFLYVVYYFNEKLKDSLMSSHMKEIKVLGRKWVLVFTKLHRWWPQVESLCFTPPSSHQQSVRARNQRRLLCEFLFPSGSGKESGREWWGQKDSVIGEHFEFRKHYIPIYFTFLKVVTLELRNTIPHHKCSYHMFFLRVKRWKKIYTVFHTKRSKKQWGSNEMV